MRRQLQIRNGAATSEWMGAGAMPQVPAGESWIFLDVTDRPEAKIGMTYNAATDTFTAPPPPAPVHPDDLPLTPREQREFMRAVKRQTDKIIG